MNDHQRAMIDQMNALGGIGLIQRVLDEVQKSVQVCVVGECIMDIYRFVSPEGISSKSPCLSARYKYQESYSGGSWAIANHLKSFCRVNQVESGVFHKKIRYISQESGQRLLEVTEIAEERPVTKLKPHNLLLMADFGHGLFECSRFNSRAFKAVNVQSNSSNFGFNVFHKHGFDYLVIDKRELQLAYYDRTSDPISLGLRAHAQYGSPIGLTMGPMGSAMFHEEQVYTCPAFTDRIVDAIGAGDAYLAITSLLMKVNAHPMVVVFLGNVYAGLKTKIIGNKSAVTREDLLAACAKLLA